MRIRELTLLSALGACAACSSQSADDVVGGVGDMALAGADMARESEPDMAMDNGSPSGKYPAPHADLPMVESPGGPILNKPIWVPVFFANEDPAMKMQILDFLGKVGTSQYWSDALSEYGVGPGATWPAVVELQETPPASLTDQEIQIWLAGKLDADDPALPAAKANMIYVLHYPSGTTITLPSGFNGTSTSCVEFGGYHSDVHLDTNHFKTDVVYAVIPRCDQFGKFSGIDAITTTESHELAEAATDPYPQTNPAYQQVDSDHLYWMLALGGGELGDMCAQEPNGFAQFGDLPYVVQRVWSNDAAAAGHDPCRPVPSQTAYFNAIPDFKDTVTINLGQEITMPGIQVPVGQSKTVDLDLFSDGDTGGSWSVKVLDFSAIAGGPSSATYSLDRNRGQNGEKLHLTIKSTRKSQYGADIFAIESTLRGASHLYYGLIGQ